MVTLKSINEHLPHLDDLRRCYAPMGTVGEMYWRIGYLSTAIADIDETRRHVTDITIYTPGSGMKPDRYYGRSGIDITDCIEDALRGHDAYGYPIDRRALIRSIQEKISESITDDTDT